MAAVGDISTIVVAGASAAEAKAEFSIGGGADSFGGTANLSAMAAVGDISTGASTSASSEAGAKAESTSSRVQVRTVFAKTEI